MLRSVKKGDKNKQFETSDMVIHENERIIVKLKSLILMEERVVKNEMSIEDEGGERSVAVQLPASLGGSDKEMVDKGSYYTLTMVDKTKENNSMEFTFTNHHDLHVLMSVLQRLHSGSSLIEGNRAGRMLPLDM